MDSQRLADDNSFVKSVVDPFMDVEVDANSQTGTDWYTLMLSASLGNIPVHGSTYASTCETLTKTTEAFASGHAIGRVNFNAKAKATEHASEHWYNQNLVGRKYHGSKTGNKARMLFDTGEWEPSQRTRAKNSAFIGALLSTSGSNMDDAVAVASAIAGEEVPVEAITHTELPMQILKREAAASAKENHTVYGHANAQSAITWDDHQLHAEILPPNAALDWSRVTAIARYIGEANCMLDPEFIAYARAIGVPYALINGCWATTTTADYQINAADFAEIPLTVGAILPSAALNDAYSGHAEGLYDAIHRMANEVLSGLVDPTLEALLRIAENQQAKSGKTKLATGTYILSEPQAHKYNAEKAADATKDSARSWDAFTKSMAELITSNRHLEKAAADTVVASRARQDYYQSIEPLLAEVCLSAVWKRTLMYLNEMLGSSSKALERASRLKRSMLNNSAPLGASCILTARIRASATPQVLSVTKRIMAGDIPKLKIAVDARYGHNHNGLLQQRAFVAALNDHLKKSKVEWAERYKKLANTYGLAGGTQNKRQSVLFGSTAYAFSNLTGYLLSRHDARFVDPAVLASSYLVKITRSYVKKRHLSMPNLAKLTGKDAHEQAVELDSLLTPNISFVDVEDFVYNKLYMFYSDLVVGKEPEDVPLGLPIIEEASDGVAATEDEEALLAAMEAEYQFIDAQPVYTVSAETVLATYDSLSTADRHAQANGYTDFYDAYDQLADKARFDRENPYTNTGLNADAKAEHATLELTVDEQPAI